MGPKTNLKIWGKGAKQVEKMKIVMVILKKPNQNYKIIYGKEEKI